MLINRVIAGLFLFIFSCSAFSENIITLAFYSNQQNIAKQLCENKEKPAMHCNGKCQLQKKLNQENNETQSPERRNESHSEVLSSKTFFSQVVPPLSALVKQQYPIITATIFTGKTSEPFHPPQSFSL